jgi:hypothetical protein
VQQAFKIDEDKELQYFHPTQYEPIEEIDNYVPTKDKMVKVVDPFDGIYLNANIYAKDEKGKILKGVNNQFIYEVIDDIEPYLQRLLLFRGPLQQSHYSEYYYKHFAHCY